MQSPSQSSFTSPPAHSTLAPCDGQGIPKWATLQRQLLDAIGEAVHPFLERYTRDDGSVIWREEWPGMDGSDDAYEGFGSFPLAYLLGGGEHLLDLGRKQWEAMTRQFTAYGQVHNEFDAYYDWMHHGESSHLLYFLGMANPGDAAFRERAVRFAGMYVGDDPEADNWDPERKLIRSPLNGSRGPRHEMTAEDWCTHRAVLDNYLAPYEDIPGHSTAHDPLTQLPWSDDAVFAEILKLMNQRMARGDVPLNLSSTSLVTHAFMHTGEAKYRQWVLDYYEAWWDRCRQNGGLMPDNVGLSGEIGECMDGKWWGGYYGYRWPHGWRTLMEATLIAAGNVLLLTGDLSCLELPRSMLDGFWSLGEERNGQFVLPARHGDSGWFDYRPPTADFWLHLHHLSQSDEDLERIARLPDRGDWPSRTGACGKSPIGYPAAPWLAWRFGDDDAYPEHSLQWSLEEVERRLDIIANDDTDPEERDVHHWQQRCPVFAGPLPQQTMGADQIYHGGLLQASLRAFDASLRRPGLPSDVACLVEGMTADGVTVTLAHTGATATQEVLLQAGGFGEHQFTEVRTDGGDATPAEGRHLSVCLEPETQTTLQIGMRRYANQPTYELPWRGCAGPPFEPRP